LATAFSTLQFELRAVLAYNHRVSEAANDLINASTRFCAVFGHPIRHSASPALQNAGIAALKLNWRYLAFEVHPDHLRAAIDGAKAMRFIGLNLTVPHKLMAVDIVDVVDPRAQRLGAINTIVFETRDAQGGWVPLGNAKSEINEVRSHGFNTDADAIIQSLKEDLQCPNLRGAVVLLVGAGGAARSAALQLAEEGVSTIWLVNRTEERARQLAADVAAAFPRTELKFGYPSGTVDLVLNATSLGLKTDDALPIDLAWLQARRPARVYDMIYRPKETPLLRAARSAGCRAANGSGMLLHQGAEALRLWTGRPPPIQVMRNALEKHLNECEA
jgi:shikimate dehydrogenase